MGKDKKEKRKSEAGEEPEIDWDVLLSRINAIANPLAHRKLTKKLLKCVKKANKQKGRHLRKGVKDVQKAVRKGERGMMILAGDINPIEVYCHLPAVCEEKGIPYCYTPSKDDLGTASGSKRSTCAVLIKPHEDYQELYDDVMNEVKTLPMPY